jgi:hypothetical protein
MIADKLADQKEILFRQIHPHFFDNGEPSSNRFMPSEKDKNKLSVDRSSLTTAEQSHSLYVSSGYQSVAVFGLTVGEFTVEDISCWSDPILATEMSLANPAHSLADYSSHVPNKQKLIAKRLKRAAITRGCLFNS